MDVQDVYLHPERCLLLDVDEDAAWVPTGQTCLAESFTRKEGIRHAEEWINPQQVDSPIWVVMQLGFYRLATDDEELAIRHALGLPLPRWAETEAA